MKIELFGRDAFAHQEKVAVEKLEKALKDVATNKEEAETSKARLEEVQEQLVKSNARSEDLEKSLHDSLEEVKNGVEMLERTQKKIKPLEFD